MTFTLFLQLNDDSCSESEVKEDDDLGTESSRSRHTLEAEQKKKKKRKSHRRSANSSGGRGPPPKSSEDNAEEVQNYNLASFYNLEKLSKC
jgi:hypothetical protein